MQMMSNVPLDFLPMNHPHSRSTSLSARSSPSSRPQSSNGGDLPRLGLLPTPEDIYHHTYNLGHLHNSMSNDHGRHSSHSPLYSLPSNDVSPSGQSPPSHNLSNSSLGGHRRPSHLRARVAASPYPRDNESVHSSSSETEDMSMFLSNPSADYHNMFGPGQHMAPTPETMHATGAFGRMTLSPDHALEKLAANVRAATTTSASDRAKQIFVQAWCVRFLSGFIVPFLIDSSFFCRLTANYAPYPDGNVPRQGLYFSYRRVCDQYGIPHINTATLGKAIRLCFPSIKTRRLGVRGNSKYHCKCLLSLFHHVHVLMGVLSIDCGIRPATSAEAEWLQDYIRKSNNNAGQQSVNAARAQDQSETSSRGDDGSGEDDDDDSEGPSSSTASKRNSLALDNLKGAPDFHDLCDKTPTTSTLLSEAQATGRPTVNSFPAHTPIRRHTGQQEGGFTTQTPSPQTTNGVLPSQYVGPQQPVSVRHLPHFPSIEEAIGSNSASTQSIAAREVWGWFQDHLDALLESVRSFRFDQFEMHLRTFWSTLGGNHREVVHAPAIAGLMAKADAIVYDVSSSRSVHICRSPSHLFLVGNLGDSSFANAVAYPGIFSGQLASAGK